eukprot:8757546-Alexandrium_andersonii.AAC.1
MTKRPMVLAGYGRKQAWASRFSDLCFGHVCGGAHCELCDGARGCGRACVIYNQTCALAARIF